jgi:SnoaL-like domain
MTKSLREAIETADFEGFAALLSPDVVWVGLAPGQLCRNRGEVLETFRRALDAGLEASPEILAETEEFLVMDPHVVPPPELNSELHQVFVLGEDHRVIEMRDFPDRRSALQAVGL